MGAYYNAVVTKNDTERKMFDTWSVNNGAKLMEHSYLFNDYVNKVLHSVISDDESVSPIFRLDWLCDYHEKNNSSDITWDDVERDNSSLINETDGAFLYYIINLDKKCYIDIIELIALYFNKVGNDEDYLHPIPILCNSETHGMGGGDLHREESQRGLWRNDNLVISYIHPNNETTDNNILKNTYFENITKDVVFLEREE
ncbi:MAG: hypothetical protein H8E55_09415 [Pelagibacterales bacterium]|nr:hypothetical protein [Pelagibacterales bacterium]